MKKVSIIVPVYNTAEYLVKCIDSIINQKYSNLELILVDDGSTDQSPAICDEYAKKDNRIKVIHKQNGGVSSARNLGLSIASGDYITFVDSDDYIFDSFSDFCERLDNQDLIISYDENMLKNATKKIKSIEHEGCNGIITFLMKNSATLETNMVSNKFFSKHVVQNLRFNEKVTIIEDLDFVIQTLLLCEKISFIPINYYFYNQRETSAMHDYSYNGIENVINSGKELLCYYSNEFHHKKWQKKIIALISENVMSGILGKYSKYNRKESRDKVLNLISQNINLLKYVGKLHKKILYIFMRMFGVKFALNLYCFLKR